MGLAARVVNVFLAPRKAYEAVAARPKVLGVLVIAILVMAVTQYLFLSTEVGMNAALDQQASVIKAIGINVPEQVAQQMEEGVKRARYTTPISFMVLLPIFGAAVAGILMAIFTVISGGAARFKQVYAVVAHSFLIGALQQVFSVPIMYARGEMTSPTQLAVFLPMLSEDGFLHHLLSALDLFYIWSTINIAIGIAVVYKRRTGGVAAVLLGIYAFFALIYATWRAF
jgi:hypothetical protein